MAEDLAALYSKRILALAMDIPHIGRLEGDCARGYARSPQCGSSVGVELRTQEGLITDIALNVKACALGQASAAIFGHGAAGASYADIRNGLDVLNQMLAGQDVPAPPRYPDMTVLRAAAPFPNRHASIQLVWLAALEALGAP